MNTRTAYAMLPSVRAKSSAGGPYPTVLATEGEKMDGIDLVMSGARLDRFKRNPVLLVSHDVAKLPIGRVDNVRTVGRELMGDLRLDMDDPIGRDVDRKIQAKVINAVSISFTVLRTKDGRAVEWELLEVSVVSVPMDADALVAGRSAGRAPIVPLAAMPADYQVLVRTLAEITVARWRDEERRWRELSMIVDLDLPRPRGR